MLDDDIEVEEIKSWYIGGYGARAIKIPSPSSYDKIDSFVGYANEAQSLRLAYVFIIEWKKKELLQRANPMDNSQNSVSINYNAVINNVLAPVIIPE